MQLMWVVISLPTRREFACVRMPGAAPQSLEWGRHAGCWKKQVKSMLVFRAQKCGFQSPSRCLLAQEKPSLNAAALVGRIIDESRLICFKFVAPGDGDDS